VFVGQKQFILESNNFNYTPVNYFVRQPFEMRTTFCEMRSFNDTSQKHDTSFIFNGKKLGKGQLERERKREREKTDVWEAEYS
jgi:hypothetical protein